MRLRVTIASRMPSQPSRLSEQSPEGRRSNGAARLGSYFQMDPTGHRRKDIDPVHPPAGPEFIIKHTGIELSEVSEDVM